MENALVKYYPDEFNLTFVSLDNTAGLENFQLAFI